MKIAVSMGFGEIVLDHDDAVKLIEILERAERYSSTYRSTQEGGPLHYIYTEAKSVGIKHIPPEMYEVAKMAGRPPKDD